jgi:hypothetical protein
VSAALILTILLQTAAAKPSPAPTATPTSTPTPTARVPTRPRTLQDVARERRLKTTPDAKGTGTTITLGSVPGATPAATPSPSPAAAPSASPATSGEAPAGDPPSAADIRVVTVSNDGIVDPVGAVRVSGTIRNAGEKTACGVVILVRILDNKGNYLASTQTPADVNILPAGETTSFHTSVQAPPGVRGARTNPDRRDVTDGSTTMAGDWKLLGGAEAKIVDAAACPK